MRKSSKVFLIIASVLIALGLVLITIGIATGGFRQVVKWAVDGDMNMNFVGISVPVYDVIFNVDEEIIRGNLEETVVTTKDDVENLEVGIGGGTLIIKETNGDEIIISSKNANKFQYYMIDNTLIIREEGNITFNTSGVITLLVPSDMELDLADLSIGGGVLEVENLQADKMVLNVGAGKINFECLQVNDLEVSVGAGEIEINKSNIENCDIDVGMGHIYYEGSITGDVFAECAMGAIEFQLDGDVDDYNYEIECSMGNIQLGNNSFSGLAVEKSIRNGADSTYTLECAMGNIQVNFK